jgi:dolichyl-phosphate beta-glucosyltransferase
MSLSRAREPVRTFVLPVYNAGPFIERHLCEVLAWLRARPEPWELIVVDDASHDETPAILDAFREVHPLDNVTIVRLLRNRGKGFAVRSALERARGAVTVFTDCDLAYPLENVDRVLAQLDDGAEAAIACRVLPESTYLISPKFFSYFYTRHIMGRIFNRLCRILAVPRFLDTQAGLKGFRMASLRPILGDLVIDGFPFDVELLRALLDRKAVVREIPVSFRYDSEPSTVRFTLDALIMLRDLVRIRIRSLRGIYRDGTAAASRPGDSSADRLPSLPGAPGMTTAPPALKRYSLDPGFTGLQGVRISVNAHAPIRDKGPATIRSNKLSAEIGRR